MSMNLINAVPGEAAIHRRAESRGLTVETRTSKMQRDRYTLIDAASGVVVWTGQDVQELVDVLAAY